MNGYSGYSAPHYEAIVYGLASHDHDVLTDLAGERGLFVAVARSAVYRHDYVARHPRASLVAACGDLDVFHVAGEPATLSATESLVGRPARIVELTAQVGNDLLPNAVDGDRQTRWHAGSQDENRWLQADLGSIREVTGVILEAGGSPSDFPRHLTVSVSIDNDSWQVVWSGTTHRRMMKSVLLDPRRAPLFVSFPPRSGRYVKLEQRGRDRHYWSVAELVILER